MATHYLVTSPGGVRYKVADESLNTAMLEVNEGGWRASQILKAIEDCKTVRAGGRVESKKWTVEVHPECLEKSNDRTKILPLSILQLR